MSRGPSSGFTAVMRLARYRDHEGIRVGVIVADEIVAVRHLNLDVPEDIPAILAGGSPRLDQIAGGIDKATRRETLDDVELLAPIPRPPKFLGAGMNYATHAAELREPPTPSRELTVAVEAMGHLKAAYPNSPVPVVSTSRRAVSAARTTRSGRPSMRSRSTTKGSWPS
jgi:2-keto-4-pentenoate hydratase/2-oxohepta-3-ene-1,7-dioic acid hydratase in catechol pathway